jgi:hypothetical protein
MSNAEPQFSHFANTRHANWTIVGVVDSFQDQELHSVEIFQGPDHDEPRLILTPRDVPQFVAGLIATVMPGDLTAD